MWLDTLNISYETCLFIILVIVGVISFIFGEDKDDRF